jgi:hypothetical protein
MAVTLCFTRHELPEGTSLAAILDTSRRYCGIYILDFDDGTQYAGQTVDLLSRFADHRHNQPGRIVAIRFSPCPPDLLDTQEREVIAALERDGARLRNVMLTGLPTSSAPLDIVVDRAKQEEWLAAGPETSWGDTMTILPDQDVAQTSVAATTQYKKLCAHPGYPDIRATLAEYVSTVLPWPHQTVGRFWIVTALPSTNRTPSTHRLSAISVNNVEMLIIAESRQSVGGPWERWGFINVAHGDLPAAEALWATPVTYKTTGTVWSLDFSGAEDLTELLAEPATLALARRLAVGQLRKGRGMMGRYHNPMLAADVLRQAATPHGTSNPALSSKSASGFKL